MYRATIRTARRYRLFLGFFLYSIICWIWLLEIDLGKLASTGFAGKFMQVIIVFALTFLSAFIYTKSMRLLFAGMKKTTRWAIPFKLVLWWSATELFVAWAVSIIWYGNGARIDNLLPFTALSHFGIWTPFGYLSRFVGLFGLSGVLFTLLVVGIKHDLRKQFMPICLIVMVTTGMAWLIYRTPNGPRIPVVVVSESSEHDAHKNVIQAGENTLVVFPEYSFTDIENETISSKVRSTETEGKVFFVGSRFVADQDKVRNQLVAGDTAKGYAYNIDKSRLIPGGEYLPYATIALLQAISADGVLRHFRETREIAKAEGAPKEMLLDFGDMRVGAGICSSIIAPEDYRNLAKNGANIFTNSAFLGIFNDSVIYNWKHKSMAKSMAMANARTFVQSASNGPSYAFDHNGQQIFSAESTATTEIAVDLNSRRTPYSLFGEYLSIGGFIWIIVCIWKSRNKR